MYYFGIEWKQCLTCAIAEGSSLAQTIKGQLFSLVRPQALFKKQKTWGQVKAVQEKVLVGGAKLKKKIWNFSLIGNYNFAIFVTPPTHLRTI